MKHAALLPSGYTCSLCNEFIHPAAPAASVRVVLSPSAACWLSASSSALALWRRLPPPAELRLRARALASPLPGPSSPPPPPPPPPPAAAAGLGLLALPPAAASLGRGLISAGGRSLQAPQQEAGSRKQQHACWSEVCARCQLRWRWLLVQSSKKRQFKRQACAARCALP
jgi:hypothetical protein